MRPFSRQKQQRRVGARKSGSKGFAPIEALESRQLMAAITSGQYVTGSITAAAQVDSYTFTANAGDSFMVNAAETSDNPNFAPQIDVYNASNTLVGSSWDYIGTRVALTSVAAGGTYTIKIHDHSNAFTNPYALTMVKAPGTQPTDADSGPLTSGAYRTGTIGYGDMDVYTFSANVGDSFDIAVADTNVDGFTPSMTIYRPNGTVAYSTWDYTGHSYDGTSVTAGGTYTVVIQDQSDSVPGSYALTYTKVPGAQTVDSDSKPITSGQYVTGSLPLGDIDTYTFTANAGDSFDVVVSDTNNTSFSPRLEVYRPDGVQMFGTWDYTGLSYNATNLPIGGTYYVVVSAQGNDDIGNYALTMAKLPGAQTVDGDSSPITTGQRKVGKLGLGDLDVYTFNASVGDSFIVDAADIGNTALSPRLEVYGPTGNQLYANWDYTGIAYANSNITVGGTYYVVVSAQGNDDTGDYALSMVKTNATQPVDDDSRAITSNQRLTGRLDLGDLDVYTFSANAGDSFDVVAGDIEGGALAPRMTVYNPSGGQMFSNWDYDGIGYSAQNAVAGTYTVVVESQGDDDSGLYTLSLAKVAGAQSTDTLDNDGGTLTSGQSRSASVSVGDLDVYTFSLSAGASATVSVKDLLADSFTPNLEVYSPTGALLFANSNGTQVNANLTNVAAGGTYYAVVRGASDDQIGTYGIALNATPGADTRGPAVTAASFDYDNVGRQRVVLTFDENIGNSFSLDDFTLVQNGTTTIPSTNLLYSYRDSSNSVIVQFSDYTNLALPDGNYTFTLAAGSVSDAAGNVNAAPTSLSFFSLAGDANHDRKVDIVDLGILASNWQSGGRSYSQGDLNYDGKVDIVDLGILAGSWQHTQPAPGSLVGGKVSGGSPFAVDRAISRVSVSQLLDMVELAQ